MAPPQLSATLDSTNIVTERTSGIRSLPGSCPNEAGTSQKPKPTTLTTLSQNPVMAEVYGKKEYSNRPQKVSVDVADGAWPGAVSDSRSSDLKPTATLLRMTQRTDR